VNLYRNIKLIDISGADIVGLLYKWNNAR